MSVIRFAASVFRVPLAAFAAALALVPSQAHAQGSPGVSVSSSSVNFGNQGVGTTSSTRSVTLTSTGTADFVIFTFDSSAACSGGPICSSGAFTCSTTCLASPSTYPPSSSCSISAQFSPSFTGTQTETIYVCDNAAGSPHLITLTGNATAQPAIYFEPDVFHFSNVEVGNTSPPKVITLVNPGSAPVFIGGVFLFGNPAFALQSTDCPSTLPPFSRCSNAVTFSPTTEDAVSATLDAGGGGFAAITRPSVDKIFGFASAQLFGAGIRLPGVEFPAAVDFGTMALGTSGTQTVTLTNTGATLLTVSIDLTAPFTFTTTCTSGLAPGASCTITLAFTATTAGHIAGTLGIATNAPNGTAAIPVTVNVPEVPIPVIRVTPRQIGYGDRLIGQPSGAQRITIRNDGSAIAHISTALSGIDFELVGSDCGATLAPQASCTMDVQLRPIGFGLRLGRVTVESDAEGSPHTIDLSGTGCRPFSPWAQRLGAESPCTF